MYGKATHLMCFVFIVMHSNSLYAFCWYIVTLLLYVFAYRKPVATKFVCVCGTRLQLSHFITKSRQAADLCPIERTFERISWCKDAEVFVSFLRSVRRWRLHLNWPATEMGCVHGTFPLPLPKRTYFRRVSEGAYFEIVTFDGGRTHLLTQGRYGFLAFPSTALRVEGLVGFWVMRVYAIHWSLLMLLTWTTSFWLGRESCSIEWLGHKESVDVDRLKGLRAAFVYKSYI